MSNRNSDQMPKIMLNLGCGQTRPTGWINTDSSLNSWLQRIPISRWVMVQLFKRVNYDLNAEYMDLRNAWRYDDNSVDVVYGSHVFEHLSSSTATFFLSEAFRVLKPDGVIRLIVPDLYQLSKNYLDQFNIGDQSAADTFLFWINLAQENTYPQERSLATKVINFWQDYPHQHKSMYDFISLSKMLQNKGFSNIQQSFYGESKYIAEIGQVENTAEGVASIYIEAKKLTN
jgi:predicted SAM-dependent methyltransferase